MCSDKKKTYCKVWKQIILKYLSLLYKHNNEVPGELSRENMKSLHVKIPWFLQTVEPRFNKSKYNEVLGITNDFLQPGQNYNKMYGTEPRQTTSSPPFFPRDSRASKTRARVKINPREKRRHAAEERKMRDYRQSPSF